MHRALSAESGCIRLHPAASGCIDVTRNMQPASPTPNGNSIYELTIDLFITPSLFRYSSLLSHDKFEAR
jgi:hypothetical protein